MDSLTENELRIVKRQYFQLVEFESLRWPEPRILKRLPVQTWIYRNLFNSDAIQFQPSERYQLRVLKQLVSRIERAIEDPEEDEISEDLMSCLSDLLSSTLPSEAISAQQKSYVTYFFPRDGETVGTSDNGVTLLEARSVISGSGTTGLRTWEASLHLGSYLSGTDQGRALISNANVMELGAGTGVISILCARHLDAKQVLATDGDEAVVDAIRSNLFLNSIDDDSVVKCAALKWGWPVDRSTFLEDHGLEDLDVVLGADVTYDKSVIPALVSTIGQLFDLKSTLRVLIAATVRNEETFAAFSKACERRQFRMEDVEYSPAPTTHQTGPFYPTSTPIRIVSVVRSGEGLDPFAI